MSKADIIMRMFLWWAIVGYFFVVMLRKPKDRRAAFLQLLVSGPIGWVVFAIITLIEWPWKRFPKPDSKANG